jgi:hypothetical protein
LSAIGANRYTDAAGRKRTVLEFLLRIIFCPLAEICDFLIWLYQDEWPAAQRFTLGCAVVVAIIAVVIFIIANN